MACTGGRTTAVTGFLLLLAIGSEVSAGYVGDRYFPSTLATTVPTAADFYNPPNLVVLPSTATTPSTREIDIPNTYSRLITKDWSVFFTETFRILEDSNRGRRSGFDNLVIGTQYQLYTNPEHQFIFTVGGTAAIGGTGTPGIASPFSTPTPPPQIGQSFRVVPGCAEVAPAAYDQRHGRRRTADRFHQPHHYDTAHGRDHAFRDHQPEDPAVRLCPGIQPCHQSLHRPQPYRDPLPGGM